MKVVSISLDPQLLDPKSVAASRIARYGTLVESYTVIVPCKHSTKITLAENVTIEGTGGLDKLLQLWHCYRKTRQYILQGACDVLSTDQYFFGLMGVWFVYRHKVALEVVALGFEKFTWLRKRIAQFVLRRSHSIRVNSNWLVSFLEQQFGIRGNKVHMVPIYVVMDTLGLKDLSGDHAAELQQARDHFKETYGDHFNILAVNRLVPDKNIEMQLRAIAALQHEYPEVLLHIAGSGPEKGKLKTRAAQLGIADRVIWHGHTTGTNLGALYKECDVFVLTSHREGWGMVIAEALTAGLPIVMTNVGAAGDLVKDGESAMVVPVGDAHAFIEVLRRVIHDDHLRQHLRAGCQTALGRLLSQEEILKRYQQSWEDALTQAH